MELKRKCVQKCGCEGGGGGHRCAQGKVNIKQDPQEMFKKLVNTNVTPTLFEISYLHHEPYPDFLEEKNIPYPLPWIFNPCASASVLGVKYFNGIQGRRNFWRYFLDALISQAIDTSRRSCSTVLLSFPLLKSFYHFLFVRQLLLFGASS